MSFVVTHDQVMKEGRALGDKVLAPLRAVIVGANSELCEVKTTYIGQEVVMPYTHSQAGTVNKAFVVAEEAVLKYGSTTAEAVDGQLDQIRIPAGAGGARGVQVHDRVIIGDREAEVLAIVTEEPEEGEKTYSKVLILSRSIGPELRTTKTFPVALCVYVTDADIIAASFGDSGIVIPAGVKLMSNNYVPGDEPEALPVARAEFKCSYRVCYSQLSDRVRAISALEDLAEIPGSDAPENDLKHAVSLALQNSGGAPVAYIAVPQPDNISAWITTLARIRDEYGIVACTTDKNVLLAVEDFVEQRSRAEAGRECVAWVSLTTPPTAVIASEENSRDLEPLRGKVVQTPEGAAVEVQAGNARFMTLGVRAGDILRTEQPVDGQNEFVIDSVVNEDAVRLQGDIPSSTNEVTLTVVRKLDEAGQLDAVAGKAMTYQNKRVRAVWPGIVVRDDAYLPGWYLCAALAGLRSGCAPHRSLTGVQILGIDEVPQSEDLDHEQLAMLAECGVWVVTKRGGNIVTSQAVTTADTQDLAGSSEGVVTNLDSINKSLRNELAKAVRNTAATPQFRGRVVGKLNKRLEQLAQRRAPGIGAQLVEGNVEVMRRHVYLEGSLVLSVKLMIPGPASTGPMIPMMEVHQRVIA